MGKTGVINRDFTGEENNVYHDVIRLFKIYRAVNWRMQIKVNQVKHRIREEYGTDLDEFLDSIYQAGMEFKEMLKYAKAYDKRAMMDIIEMYRPLLISKSVVNGKFDEDLYQEFVYTMLMCILKFPYPQSKPEE